jgi:hypothetical protein
MLTKQVGTWKPWALGTLHQRLVGTAIQGQHRAMEDVAALERCLQRVFSPPGQQQSWTAYEGGVLDAVRVCNSVLFS